MFKYAVDILTADPTGATAATTPLVALMPATLLIGYGAARAGSALFNELRNAVFAKASLPLLTAYVLLYRSASLPAGANIACTCCAVTVYMICCDCIHKSCCGCIPICCVHTVVSACTMFDAPCVVPYTSCSMLHSASMP